MRPAEQVFALGRMRIKGGAPSGLGLDLLWGENNWGGSDFLTGGHVGFLARLKPRRLWLRGGGSICFTSGCERLAIPDVRAVRVVWVHDHSARGEISLEAGIGEDVGAEVHARGAVGSRAEAEE